MGNGIVVNAAEIGLSKCHFSLLHSGSGCVAVPVTVWHEIFAGYNFAICPAIRKNKFPQIKITANIFPTKIYSRINIF